MAKEYPFYDGQNHSTKILVRCPKCNHLSKASTMRVHSCGGNYAALSDVKLLNKEMARDSRHNVSSRRSMELRNA